MYLALSVSYFIVLFVYCLCFFFFSFLFFFFFMCFFFQAEDGIRDLVRSRGLGDVYKRQGVFLEIQKVNGIARGLQCAFQMEGYVMALAPFAHAGRDDGYSVSYTHLTLPTSDLV